MSRAPQDAVADLRRMLVVLGRERVALLAADQAQLSRLAPRKAALLDRLETAAPSQDAASADLARQVRDQARRNGELYLALIDGLKDARALIERARQPHSGRTYARDGARHRLEGPTSTVEKRA